MADEEMERNSPESTSVATPPQVDDSPEMVNQPLSPEEGISSSTDQQPPENPDSPDEPGVSSTSELEPNAAPSYSDASQEIENQSQPDEPPDHELRRLLESPPAMPKPSQSVRSPVQKALIKTGLVGAAVVVPTVPVALESAETVSVVGAHEEASSQEITKETIKQDTEMSDDSNQQFDVDDSSSAPKSSPENVNFGSDSSPSGSDVHEDESRASGSAVTETSGLESNSSPRMGIVKGNICSETEVAETVGLESQLHEKTSSDVKVSGSDTTENMELSKDSSPLKTDASLKVSGSGPKKNIGLTDELSPSKTSSDMNVSATGTKESTGLQVSPPPKSVAIESRTPDRRRGPFSPKRKSPTKLQHSSPKRYAPGQSPDKKQSDSQMSTLLEELDIQETENNTESAASTSEQVQEMSSERTETGESQNEDQDEDEDEMEVQETDFQTEREKNNDMFEK